MVLVYAIGAQPVRRAERMHFEEAKIGARKRQENHPVTGGEASGMAAWARHVDIPGRAARLEIDADHPARPATDAQAVAAVGGDVNGAIINREPLRVVAGVELRQPDAPHARAAPPGAGFPPHRDVLLSASANSPGPGAANSAFKRCVRCSKDRCVELLAHPRPT